MCTSNWDMSETMDLILFMDPSNRCEVDFDLNHKLYFQFIFKLNLLTLTSYFITLCILLCFLQTVLL